MVTTGQPHIVPSRVNDEVAKLFAEIYAQHKSQLQLVHKMNQYRATQQGDSQSRIEKKIPQLPTVPYPWQLYYLSKLATQLLLEVPRRTINRGGSVYREAFTGKELINILCHHIWRYLPTKALGVERDYSLALSWSLESQQFLVRLDIERGTITDDLIQDDDECVISFSEGVARNSASNASGVFTPMLPCYSPACDGLASRKCYSPTCPRQNTPGEEHLPKTVLIEPSVSLEHKSSAFLQLIRGEEEFISRLSLLETHVIEVILAKYPLSPGDTLIDQMFSNISDIKASHKFLLDSLYSFVEGRTPHLSIGDIYSTALNNFILSYPMYLENLPRALCRLRQERERNGEFDRILKQCENLPVLLRTRIPELLVLPFLQLQNYPRKLEDLLLYDDWASENSGATALSEAIDAAKSILSVSRLLNLESEMACMDRRPKHAGNLPETSDEQPSDNRENPSGNSSEQSETLVNKSSVDVAGGTKLEENDSNGVDELSGFDISSLLAEFDEKIDSRLVGGFGIIRRGILEDGTHVAVKTLKAHHFGGVDYKQSKRFRREVQVWRSLQHVNVLPFLGVAEVHRAGVPMSLVSPWMKNGNSLDFCSKHPDVLRVPIIKGISEGLAYLHSQSVVHGDIKASNILISDFGTPHICDFGLAYVSSEEPELSVSTTVRRAGSWRHMAIELHESDSPGLFVTRESDMWAFGMVCIELFTGFPPFRGQSGGTVVLSIMSGRLPGRPDAVECQDQHWDFIRRCWERVPTMRPNALRAIEVFQ